MSWEALRLTSRTPSEIHRTIGPNGVDGLIRQVLTACWNALPADDRALKKWEALAREVYERNMGAWAEICQPSPESFFHDLRPEPADGFMRQAMVLCWMMLPRGKRSLASVRAVVGRIFDRNVASWQEDERLLTKGPFAPARPRPAPPTKKPAPRATIKKKPKKARK